MRNTMSILVARFCCSQSSLAALGPTLLQNRRISNTVDVNNLNIFKQSNSEWMNERTGAFKPLHSLNCLRVPWIVSHFKPNTSARSPLLSVKLLDVGCGGGLLSLALCRLGANVVGLDANKNAISLACNVAQSTLKNEQLEKLEFSCSSIEDFSANNAQSEILLIRFDGVIVSEVLEHVSDVPTFLRHCVDLAKPKSHLMFSTINKTFLSKIFAVWLAEDVFSVVPKGVHDWQKFVPPSALRQILLDYNCHVRSPLGMFYNPITNLWSWSRFDQVNYALSATRID